MEHLPASSLFWPFIVIIFIGSGYLGRLRGRAYGKAFVNIRRDMKAAGYTIPIDQQKKLRNDMHRNPKSAIYASDSADVVAFKTFHLEVLEEELKLYNISYWIVLAICVVGTGILVYPPTGHL